MSWLEFPLRAAPLSIILLVAACGHARQSAVVEAPSPDVVGPAASGTGQGAAPGATSARVLPGDILKLRIWREPDLSGEFAVRDDGNVIVPKLGTIAAVNFTPDSLRLRLEQGFQQYLRNPTIEVTLLRRVSVLGEVKRPGSYPVTLTATVADLLSEAGGFTGAADQDRLLLTRRGRVLRSDVPRYASLAELSVNSGDELYANKKPAWMRVSRTVVSTAMTTAAVLYAIVRLRGASN